MNLTAQVVYKASSPISETALIFAFQDNVSNINVDINITDLFHLSTLMHNSFIH
jgi:hypothetical protein